MKFISTLLLSIIFLSANSQQWKFFSHYSLALPRQEMSHNIQPVHSLQAGARYQLPGPLHRLSVGGELGIGSYAHKTIEQTFRFDDNTTTVVPVNYFSNAFNANLQAKFDLISSERSLVVPYVQAKGGLYSLFSNIYIEDPDDPAGCHALERDNIIKDRTMYWSAGGGLQIDPAIFSRKKGSGRVLIDISANMVRGGTLNYINTKHLVDAQDVPEPGGKPLSVKFINASTQSIHEHTVAQVYTSPLKLTSFTAGVVVMIGK